MIAWRKIASICHRPVRDPFHGVRAVVDGVAAASRVSWIRLSPPTPGGAKGSPLDLPSPQTFALRPSRATHPSDAARRGAGRLSRSSWLRDEVRPRAAHHSRQREPPRERLDPMGAIGKVAGVEGSNANIATRRSANMTRSSRSCTTPSTTARHVMDLSQAVTSTRSARRSSDASPVPSARCRSIRP